MKIKHLTVTTLTVVTAVLLTQHAIAMKGGTSILHFMLTASMGASDIAPNATGSVNAKRNQQGGADNQRLSISVAHLNAATTYKLWATTVDNSTPTEAVEFTTDGNGAAVLNYVTKKTGKGNGGGDPLPVVLDPISKLRTLDVSNTDTQTVLSADITAPDSLQYLIKRAMTNDVLDADAAASLRIKSNSSTDQLRIRASGLDAAGTYFLAINGNIAEMLTSDAGGNLSVNAWPAGSPDVLDVTSLAILNSESNSVLGSTLP